MFCKQCVTNDAIHYHYIPENEQEITTLVNEIFIRFGNKIHSFLDI